MHHAVEPASVTVSSRPARHGRITSLIAVAIVAACPLGAFAQDVSNPATLQLFEAGWDTVELRMVDVFYAGYGAMWLPPPGRADSGDESVGYDVYDRFDLGDQNRATVYGTKTGLQTTIGQAHSAGVNVYTDLILNHNGFSDLSTTDGGNSFLDAGGYPGFALSLPGDIDGDFHGSFEGGDLNGRLSGLIDIAQEKTHAFIRHPVTPGDPNNVPAGTTPAFGRLANVPTASNTQFYPDQALGGTQIDIDPGPGQTFITRHDFNTATPLAGDPTVETAEQLLMRHAQWMVQEVGVDGFRIDAAKHFPASTLAQLDRAVFRASNQTNLDGSIKPTFSFSELLDGNKGVVQSRINKGLTNPNAIDPADFQVQGNRDALDFPLFFAMQGNLTGNGGSNNWHAIRNATQDTQDDGLRNGTQGVSFVNSHDALPGGTPFLEDVAFAYTLMRPGDAIVYHNAKEFDPGRSFPVDGRDDALGGFGSDTVTTLVNLRNTHGRGAFHERWVDDAFNPNGFSNIYIYERGNSAIVALNSSTANGEDTRNGVQTTFAPGTHLVELTGNADDLTIDPNDDIPSTIVVNASSQVNVTMPRNRSDNGNFHGKGFVIYGLQTPQGAVSIPDASSTDLGAGLAAASATTLVGDVDIINNDSFTVRLDTTAVTLPDSFRDFNADGDSALIKIDGGIDLNSSGGVDFTTPGSVTYGFENFTGLNTPGFGSPTGDGVYQQTIDATGLSEGYHFITTRAFRHRTDGGPEVFSDFKRVVYVDRLLPESEFLSFDPNGTGTGNLDLFLRSTDQTAIAVFVHLDLPANATEGEILDLDHILNTTAKVDRDLFRRSYLNIKNGNHVVTVVTLETTGKINIQRFAGLSTTTGNGAGLGDLDSSGTLTPSDLNDPVTGFEHILYSQNDEFHAAADLNADGLVDNRDLFLLDGELTLAGADLPTLTEAGQVLLRRGNLNADGVTDSTDIDFLFTQFGSTAWLTDLDVSGLTGSSDVDTLVQTIFGTNFGDLDLNGVVDENDLATMQANNGLAGLGWAGGDVDGSGLIDQTDLNILLANLSLQGDLNADGFVGIEDLNLILGNWNQTVTPGNLLAGDPTGDGFVGIEDLNAVLGNWNAGSPPPPTNTVPEPTTLALITLGTLVALRRHRR